MNEIILSSINLNEFEKMIESSVVRAMQLQPQPDASQYISIAKAASILSVSTVTIYEYIKDGKLTKYKIDTTTRLLKSQVLSIVKAQ